MKSKVAWFALILAALWISTCGNPIYYTSKPFDVRVVDADSGRPIEGAVVLARWQLHKFSLDAPRTGSVLKILETVTDKDGRFHINGFTKLNPRFERLITEDPGVIVYKQGYLPARSSSAYTLEEHKNLGATRKSKLSGQTLRLKRWDGDNKRMADYLSSIQADFGPTTEACVFWQAAPRFAGTLDAEAKRIRREEPSVRISWLQTRDPQKDCGVDPKLLNTAEK